MPYSPGVPEEPTPTKVDLRSRLREIAAGISRAQAEQSSRLVCGRLAGWGPFVAARTVAMFLPIQGEVDLRALGEAAIAQGKCVCLPRIDWATKRMAMASVPALSGCLVAGRHGILEPPPDAPEMAVREIDLILVPGLGFDLSGRRIGRGAGFYDRFLADPELAAATCGVCFEAQIVPRIPTDTWDIPVKAVATEGRLIVVP